MPLHLPHIFQLSFQRYQNLIDKYVDSVRGQFYGHDHEDYVKILRTCDDQGKCEGDPSSALYAGPSLTEGWPSENPAIRYYDYDRETGEIIDSHTYSMNITEANVKGLDEVEWYLEYSALKSYGMTDVSASSWSDALERMKSDPDLWWLHHQHRSREYDGVISSSSGAKQCSDKNNATCALNFLCFELWVSEEGAASCVEGA